MKNVKKKKLYLKSFSAIHTDVSNRSWKNGSLWTWSFETINVYPASWKSSNECSRMGLLKKRR